ncbi:MAG: hypothetical protein PHI90_05710 [Clostridia bacterium]|nr:hypothetical protein [Clostridia bacterium]MDD4048311.1 hypothetical protein [Clostridia bacterium]
MYIVGVVALIITIRLWKWYDHILGNFSIRFRVLDILTWGIFLWYFIVQYRKSLNAYPQVYLLQNEMSMYFNIHTWFGLTIIGFIVIGFVRLFIKRNIFD